MGIHWKRPTFFSVVLFFSALLSRQDAKGQKANQGKERIREG
jgi:hypothetical protein